MKKQSRRHSLFETLAGTAIGFVVAFTLQLYVVPLFGPQTTAVAFWITVMFTVASIARGYCVRRVAERFRGKPDYQEILKQIPRDEILLHLYGAWTAAVICDGVAGMKDGKVITRNDMFLPPRSMDR